MFSTLLLLLLTATSGIKCIELVQPAVMLVKPGESFSVPYSYGQSLTSSASVVKRPGESVTLSCTVSGFSMSSYLMHWIRQKPGQGLEWIGRIDTGTGTTFAQSLQGQFSITKDTNKNMLYLEVKSLKAEDTAVYYYVFCATELIQPDSLLIKPGETLTITCKVSGASIADSSSPYGTAWIRQPAGKVLEWINAIYYEGGIHKKDSLKDKFVVSRDTSSNIVTLRGQNMQTEDTAVYYCARDSQ
ncbi:hypothetical protein QTP70_001461 [Hemibagrus guttatus]|uniref:Ig-like domain-containing protein n=1 Tax=Hemibagrus guttatus TaxID=175788 RepID=A0AAE0UVS3_9TELE|nr:hypothetical protein QTP70_001461 [Hemibagrus guttatus]